MEAIVSATKEPYKHHKDVSQQFRVSARLVSVLVQESIKNPSKLKAHRDKEIVDEQKRIAI